MLAFSEGTFYFDSKRSCVFFSCTVIWSFIYWLGQWHRGFSPAKNQGRVLSRFPLIYFLLIFCSQEERGRRGWWHERAGSLGRNHVTTAVTGWKKTLITYSGCKCVVLRRKHKQNVFIFNFNPKQWELHCCFLHSMVCTKERKGSRGNCLQFMRLNLCKKVFAKSHIQLMDCATATAGSSSSKFGPYWIEISWKTLCNFKSV